jgi:hypothetical protein
MARKLNIAVNLLALIAFIINIDPRYLFGDIAADQFSRNQNAIMPFFILAIISHIILH